MSKSIRRQLADALHEIRERENAVEAAVHDRDVRIADLEADNHRLRKRLRAAQRESHAMLVLAGAIQQRADRVDTDIEGTLSFASGKPDGVA